MVLHVLLALYALLAIMMMYLIKTVQIQINWLLMKPADLDLHSFQMMKAS